MSSMSTSSAARVSSMFDKSIDIPRDISFRGDFTLINPGGSGRSTLKQSQLSKLIDNDDGFIYSNKVVITDLDRNISGLNQQTNMGQFIFDKSNDNEDANTLFKRSRGISLNKTETFHGNNIGALSFQPYVGTTYIETAGINIKTYKKSYGTKYSGSEIIFSNSGGSDINSGKHDSLKIDSRGNLNILKSRELRLNTFRDTNFSGFRPSVSTSAPGYTIELPADKGDAGNVLSVVSVGFGAIIKMVSDSNGFITSVVSQNAGQDYDLNYYPEINTNVNMTGSTLKQNGNISSASVIGSNTISLAQGSNTANFYNGWTIETINPNSERIISQNTGNIGSTDVILSSVMTEATTTSTQYKLVQGHGTVKLSKDASDVYSLSYDVDGITLSATPDYYINWTIVVDVLSILYKGIITSYTPSDGVITIDWSSQPPSEATISNEISSLTNHTIVPASIKITSLTTGGITNADIELLYVGSGYIPNQDILVEVSSQTKLGWSVSADAAFTTPPGEVVVGPGLTGGGNISNNIAINLDLSGAAPGTSNYMSVNGDKILIQSGSQTNMPTISNFLSSIAGTGLLSDSSTGKLTVSGSQSIPNNISDNFKIFATTNNHPTHFVEIGKGDFDNLKIKGEYKTSVDLGIQLGTIISSGGGTSTIVINKVVTDIIPQGTNLKFTLPDTTTTTIEVAANVLPGSNSIELTGDVAPANGSAVGISPDNYLDKTIIQTQSSKTNNDSTIQFDIGDISEVVNIDTDGLSVRKGIIESINIDNRGSGYSLGDTLVITESPFGAAYTAIATIVAVSVTGEITTISIRYSGLGYSSTTLPIISVTTNSGSSAILTPQVNDSRYISAQVNNPDVRYDGYFQDLYIAGDQNFEGTLKVQGQGAVELGKPSNFSFSEDDSNFLFGFEAGKIGGIKNTTNKDVTFSGYQSGYNSTTIAKDNTFYGSNSGLLNTDGEKNTYIGFKAGFRGLITTDSVCVGNQAGGFLTGGYNTAIGSLAGYAGYSSGGVVVGHAGEHNVYLGYQTESRGGSNNLYAGSGSGREASGSNGVFLGFNTGGVCTGDGNVLIGVVTGNKVTTGNDNTLIGRHAGDNITTGNSNSCFGKESGYNITSGYDNVCIGRGTGPTSGDELLGNRLYIDARGTTGSDSLIHGFQATAAAQENNALSFNAAVTISNQNSAGTLYVQGGTINFAGEKKATNLAAGTNWKINAPNGSSTFDGQRDTNIQVVDEGSGMPTGMVGTYNTFMGFRVCYGSSTNPSGDGNSIFGSSAGYKMTTAGNNTYIGMQAGYNNISGGENTIIGRLAGYNVGVVSPGGGFNTMVGSQAGSQFTSGSYNTLIGGKAGNTLSTSSISNICLGYRAGPSSSGPSSYRVYIDAGRITAATGAVAGEDSLIYGDQSSLTLQTLSFNANTTIKKTSGSSNGTLTVQGGEISFWGASKMHNEGLGTAGPWKIFSPGPTDQGTDTNLVISDSVGIEITSNRVNTTVIGSGSKANGSRTTILGAEAGNAGQTTTTSQDDNTFIGYKSGNYENGSQTGNTFIGSKSGVGMAGSQSICIGYNSGFSSSANSNSNHLIIDPSGSPKGTDSLIYGNKSASTGTPQNNTLSFNAGVTIKKTGIGADPQSDGSLTVEGDAVITGELTASLSGITFLDYNIDLIPSSRDTEPPPNEYKYNFLITNNSNNVPFSSGVGGIEKTTIIGTYTNAVGITTNSHSNTLFGHGCGQDITVGDRNTLIGVDNGYSLTTGYRNTLIGVDNLYTTKTTNFSVGIGSHNMYNTGDGGDGNIGIGTSNCINVQGSYNIGIGYQCVQGTSSSNGLSYCVGIGNYAGQGSTGVDNNFIGNEAGRITTGGNNIGVGTLSLRYLGTGHYNICLGREAGAGSSDGANAKVFSHTIAIGYKACSSLTSALNNISIGYQAGMATNIGDSNVFIGENCGTENTSGHSNVFIGENCGKENTSGHRNVALGSNAGGTISGDDNICIGTNAGPISTDTTSSNLLYIDKSRLGQLSLIYGDMSSRNIKINGSLTITGSLTAGLFGSITADITGGVTVPSNKTITIPSINQVIVSGLDTNMYLGYQSAFGGVRTGYSTGTTGNTFFGYRSGHQSNSSADYNTYIGYDSGYNGLSSEYCTAIGPRSLFINSTGKYNTCLGFYTGYFVKGSYNTCIGHNAGPTVPSSANYGLYIDPYTRKGTDSLIYGYGPPTSTSRYVRVNSRFYVKSGEEAYSSYWYTYSDISLKKDIFKIDEYINDKIDMLEPVFYTLKSNDKKDVGFIAQEVQKVFPLLVSKAMDGLLTIDYSKLTPYLVKGAQENNNKIKELEKKLDEEKDKREKMEQFFKEEIEKLRKEILRK